MRRSLTKRERLKKRSDLRRIFASERQAHWPGAKLKYVRNELEWNRIAISLARKFGTAVERNRAKRVVREIYRNMKGEIAQGYDIAIILYPGDCDFPARREQVLGLLRKAGLLAPAVRGHAD